MQGLGLAVVRAMLTAAPDTMVVLGCRNLVRGETAVRQLETELSCQDRLLALQLDVTSQESDCRKLFKNGIRDACSTTDH